MSTTSARADPDAASHRLVERYVRLVTMVPQVRRVLLEQTAGGPRIWTVISARPFDDAPRDALYQAELEVLQEEPLASMDFRLVNLDEFPLEAHASLLPPGAAVLLHG